MSEATFNTHNGEQVTVVTTVNDEGIVIDFFHAGECIGTIGKTFAEWLEEARMPVVTTSSAGETLTIRPPTDYNDQWTVGGDLREVVSFNSESTNYIVTDLLLAEGWPQIVLDPEYSCFFAYLDSEAEATKLADDAMRLALKLANGEITTGDQ